MNEERDIRRLKIDLSLLESAMEDASGEHSCYLDLETGDTLLVTDDTRRQLNEIYEENAGEKGDDININPILAGLDISDWQKEALREADRVDQDFGVRYIAIPRADSDEAYCDMEDFISTVQNNRLQDRLTEAIRQHRPFRRFKDVLEDYPEEQERWFNLSNSRIHERALEWLKDQGIEPV